MLVTGFWKLGGRREGTRSWSKPFASRALTSDFPRDCCTSFRNSSCCWASSRWPSRIWHQMIPGNGRKQAWTAGSDTEPAGQQAKEHRWDDGRKGDTCSWLGIQNRRQDGQPYLAPARFYMCLSPEVATINNLRSLPNHSFVGDVYTSKVYRSVYTHPPGSL